MASELSDVTFTIETGFDRRRLAPSMCNERFEWSAEAATLLNIAKVEDLPRPRAPSMCSDVNVAEDAIE